VKRLACIPRFSGNSPLISVGAESPAGVGSRSCGWVEARSYEMYNKRRVRDAVNMRGEAVN
jgi:hypothetical protein